jgi:probable HAF family extracellular repeat protein
MGINESGHAVGYSSTSGNAAQHAFFYSDGLMNDLGTLGGALSVASDINDPGQIVGHSSISGDMAQHAFLYESGTMTDLGTLGGRNSYAVAINNNGQVVGHSSTLDNLSVHAFLYSGQTMTDLGTLGGTQSVAEGVNDSGQVVGYAYTAGNAARHAFLYSDGAMTDLNSVLNMAGWELESAMAINSAGEIVGYGIFKGKRSAFLLTPDASSAVPEPASSTIFTLGALVMAGYGWRGRKAVQAPLAKDRAINNSGFSVSGLSPALAPTCGKSGSYFSYSPNCTTD